MQVYTDIVTTFPRDVSARMTLGEMLEEEVTNFFFGGGAILQSQRIPKVIKKKSSSTLIFETLYQNTERRENSQVSD